MKKLIKMLICAVLVFAMLCVSSFAAFSDMPENEAERAALTRAVENGLLQGVGNDMIAPYATISRAQMGAIIVRAFGAKSAADISKFQDTSKDKWYYDEMAKAVHMGAFEGDGGSCLYPDKEITYQEAFLVLSRVFDLRYKNENCLDLYSDKSAVASWAKDGVIKIVSGGYYESSMLNPNAAISRVEFAKIMDKLVTTYIDEAGTYNNLPKGNTLVRCDGVILDGITVEGANSRDEGDLIIIGDGVSSVDIINANGVNAVVRGKNANLSGIFGLVRAFISGTSLTPDASNIGVKQYPDGTSGVISAVSGSGAYINLEASM